MEKAENPAAKKSRMNVDDVRSLLCEAAQAGQVFSYSELLMLLGYSFSRPKMRALCKVLDAIDAAGRGVGEPELACLVVREDDGLPGQGWWLARHDFVGEFESHAARRYLKDVQQIAFDYWQKKA
ncbi:ribose-phosphate pyrophosphokinase [Sphingorhabdus arenilitoris]|uniref:Ribose-phosphate pyrophosphokinase n=1 Tax=Sphingorhabdus arenilitoris TaxID=1490041 RepID=A0ABV8RBR7_9SPHN